MIGFFQNELQGSECLKPGSKGSDVRNISTMPPPKKLVHMESDGMPRQPPRAMPPPPPKFAASKSPPLPPPNFAASKSPPSPPPKFAASKSPPSSPPKFVSPVLNNEPISGDDPLN